MDSQEALNYIMDELPDELTTHKYSRGKGKRVLLVENDSYLCEIILQNDEDMEAYIDIVYYKLNSRGDPTEALDVDSELTQSEASDKLYRFFENE